MCRISSVDLMQPFLINMVSIIGSKGVDHGKNGRHGVMNCVDLMIMVM